MPVQNFENKKVDEVLTYAKEIIDCTQGNTIVHRVIFELGKGKRAEKKERALVEFLKKNNYRVYEKIEGEDIVIRCLIGDPKNW